MRSEDSRSDRRTGVPASLALLLSLPLLGSACGGKDSGGPDGQADGDTGEASLDGDAAGEVRDADADADGDAVEDIPVVPPVEGAWTQHAHDAQRTSYTAQGVPWPWRWKWSWNGPDADGRVPAGRTPIPRNVQPVTGGGRVYVAHGPLGVAALSATTGAVLWTAAPGGEFVSTLAVDPDGVSVWAASTDGRLYQLAVEDGRTLGSFDAGAPIRVPPCLFEDRVVIAAGSRVIAVARADRSSLWSYDAGAEVQTPAAWSPSRNVVVVGSADLQVHAIDAAGGTRRWVARPSPVEPDEEHEFAWGWPVVAEAHGLVVVRLRLPWTSIWDMPPLTDNASIRALFESRPDIRPLHALDLDDGSSPFILNVGNGGYGDGGYLPMGPPPVVKRFGDGTEVLYAVIRGDNRYDSRWDSHFGEVVLDETTVPGLRAGYVRWIDFRPGGGERSFLLTDEQPNVAMAGDVVLGGHWEVGWAVQVLDRGPTVGSYDTPLPSVVGPVVATSQDDPSCPWTAGHYCPDGVQNTRTYPPGFYIYYGAGAVYDEFWTEYSTWVVSDGLVMFRSTDGALAALEAGDPAAGKCAAPLPRPPSPAPLPPVPGVLSPEEARAHVGREATVRGRIAEVFDNGKAVYLGFRKPHRGGFLVRIPREAWPRFPAHPAALFREGDPIEVRGRLRWYQGDPEILVGHPESIRRPDPDTAR